MALLWKSLTRKREHTYQLERLVDARVRQPEEAGEGGQHIICDIDKTYLETEFESIARMVRIAFEAATDKVTVTGASEVLQRARWGDFAAPLEPKSTGGCFPRPLHFISSSPPQLRAVLEEKLMLDGLDWTSETFKNQVYNIRMGRMDQLRQHVAYKSLAILNRVRAAGLGARFYMIGDNAETDAYIYLGIKLFLENRLSPDGFSAYLAAAGVEESVGRDIQGRLPPVSKARVDLILIRNVPGYRFAAQPPLTSAVHTFDNFYQAALLLMVHGVIAPAGLWDLTRRFHNHYGLSQGQLHAELSKQRRRLAVGSSAREAIDDVIRRLGASREPSAGDIDDGELSDESAVAGEAFAELSEAEILQQARLWMQRLRGEQLVRKGKAD